MIFVPYILFLVIVIIFYNYKRIPSLQKINIVNSYENIPRIYIQILLFSSTVITQLYTLDIEVIDHDVNAFMIMGQEILRGNLPYEFMFDNKGPLLYFAYSIPAVFGKLHIVKIFNDLIFALLICIMYSVSLNINRSSLKGLALLPPVYFALYMSYPTGHPGYSEIYCLLFLSLGFLSLIKFEDNKKFAFKSGMYFSISYLISPSVVLFIITFTLLIFIKAYKEKDTKVFVQYISGASIPVFLIMFIYAINGSLNKLIYALIIFPLEYTAGGSYEISTFFWYLRYYLSLENYFSLGILTIFIFLLYIFRFRKSLLKLIKFNNDELIENVLFVLTFASIMTYFLTPQGWFHYLLYYFFFSSFMLLFIRVPKINTFNTFLILLCVLNVLPFMARDSLKIIRQIDVIESSYPIYNNYKTLEESYDIESILALGHNTMLFYFNLPNASYFVHPNNYRIPDYLYGLINFGLLGEYELNEIIENDEVDLIICDKNIIDCSSLKNYKKLDINEDYFLNKKKSP